MRKSARTPAIAGIDIGTTKTCAVVAIMTPEGLRITGVGEAPASGLRRGVVVDGDETVRSIEAAVERAERMAGVQVDRAYVGVTGEHLRGANNRAVVAVSSRSGAVEDADVRRVLDAARLVEVGADRRVVHALPCRFFVDGYGAVADPVGIAGTRLQVETHVVTGGSAVLADVLACVERAGIETSGLVFEPLASHAALTRGASPGGAVAVIDVGGGTTDLAVCSGGAAVLSAAVPAGGNAFTSDIAAGLGTSLAEAERVKRGAGSLRPEDDGAAISVRGSDGTARVVTGESLRRIVGPRTLDLFERLRSHLEERLPRGVRLAEIVLTGGGARLRGLDRAAAQYFGVPARVGTPASMPGLVDGERPELSTAVGLVLLGPTSDGADWPHATKSRGFGHVAGWFGELWN